MKRVIVDGHANTIHASEITKDMIVVAKHITGLYKMHMDNDSSMSFISLADGFSWANGHWVSPSALIKGSIALGMEVFVLDSLLELGDWIKENAR